MFTHTILVLSYPHWHSDIDVTIDPVERGRRGEAHEHRRAVNPQRVVLRLYHPHLQPYPRPYPHLQPHLPGRPVVLQALLHRSQQRRRRCCRDHVERRHVPPPLVEWCNLREGHHLVVVPNRDLHEVVVHWDPVVAVVGPERDVEGGVERVAGREVEAVDAGVVDGVLERLRADDEPEDEDDEADEHDEAKAGENDAREDAGARTPAGRRALADHGDECGCCRGRVEQGLERIYTAELRVRRECFGECKSGDHRLYESRKLPLSFVLFRLWMLFLVTGNLHEQLSKQCQRAAYCVYFTSLSSKSLMFAVSKSCGTRSKAHSIRLEPKWVRP